MFDKRLDFLMNITHMSNAALAKAVNIDPSAVSRLRSGKRSLPRYPDFLPSMASFFAKSLVEDYQKKTVAEEISPGVLWPDNPAYASNMIYHWLLDDGEATVFRLCPDSAPKAPAPLKAGYYYGKNGLCYAVVSLLKAVIADGKPRDVLLVYEGDSDLFEAMPDAAEEWLRLFKRVSALGCGIRLIRVCQHPPLLVLERAKKWLPACSGISMPSFSCPRAAELMRFRMLLVASGLSAVESTIYGKSPDGQLVQLIADKPAVRALEHEFCHYEELCSPLSELISAALPAQSMKFPLQSGGSCPYSYPYPKASTST